jgi:hypothetical protein
MSSLTTKTNYQHAITVIQSDTVEIPYPANLRVSASVSVPGTTITPWLIYTGFSFSSINIRPGDIAVNKTTGAIAYVTGYTSDDVLDLSANIFTAAGQVFELYSSMENSGITYDAPLIYNAAANANYSVLTAGGQTVTFTNLPVGILPVQVRRVNVTGSTASTTIVALW